MIRIPANGWRPREYQRPAWRAWERGIKRSLLHWHRRSGKDEVGLHKIAVSAVTRTANYWTCLPQFNQARRAIWEAVNPHTGMRRIDEAFPKELRERVDNTSMTIEFKGGSSYRVVGSDNPDSLVGAPPAGIVFSEWALSNPSAWGYLSPILAENNGWADFNTTPRGKNHSYDMHQAHKNDPEWFCQILTVDDTGIVPLSRIEKDRLDYQAIFGEDAGNALIDQEYYCSFTAAILGAYYGKEMEKAEREGRIGKFEPWPGLPVHTAWDLGIRDSMVIWFFQIIPGAAGTGRIRVLACYSATSFGIGHYAKVIKDKIRNWEVELKKKNLQFSLPKGKDWVPHDAKQREMGSWNEDTLAAKQRIEVMLECHLNPKVIRDHAVPDGISAVRQVLHRCQFDEVGCGSQALEGMRQYQTEWDDDKKIFMDRPLHNWASHFADGFRTLAMAFKEIVPEAIKEPGRQFTIGEEGMAELASRGVPPVTMEDLWKDHERRQQHRRRW